MSEAPTLEGGTYEVLRKRLSDQAGDLRSRVQKLNESRQETFGSVEPELIATDRVSTPHRCTARDMVSIGDECFLFGYNIQFGLKTTTEVADVFSTYRWDGEQKHFLPVELKLKEASRFDTDFRELFRFYKDAVFVKFLVIGPHLYTAFRIGREVTDLKVFKFLLLGSGELEYLGNRFDHEYVFPEQQSFTWERAHREMQRSGTNPHISIDDRVFVETVGGDLTIKIEDNTADGLGIYREDVTDRDQSLDDAEIFYAFVGSLILLKILPYREEDYRYLVFNEKTKQVTRCDAIDHSCILLPEDHGIIFANGYLLDTGDSKIFDTNLDGLVFERRVASSNGEDFLYAFYHRLSGHYVLLPYNLITQQVDTPIICNGFSLFEDGTLLYFRSEDEPAKHHALQVWNTPYQTQEAVATTEEDPSFLAKLGNAEIVRALAECQEILTLTRKDDTFGDLYISLVRQSGDVLDRYFWIADEKAHNLAEPLSGIQEAAQSALNEFDKVTQLRQRATEELARQEEASKAVISKASYASFDSIEQFVELLNELRTSRGQVITARELRYIDTATLDALEKELEESTDRISGKCVDFLLQEQALQPYEEKIAALQEQIDSLKKVQEAKALEEEIAAVGTELEMLIDVVSNLKIEDATETTRIIDAISALYAQINQSRAAVKNRREALAQTEGAAQFSAQLKLLQQSVASYLDLIDSPEAADEYLTKAMIQLEELEGQFGDVSDFQDEIADRRDEIYSAFEGRKQALIEDRNRRVANLTKSADRLFTGITHRLESFATIEEINGYLAGDLMVEKVRNLVTNLEELGDSTKAADVKTRLKTVGEDAIRQLKDRNELYTDGGNVIKLGNHAFTVNEQELQLSIIPRDGQMAFHLGGTDYFETIEAESFGQFRDLWEQQYISESPDVYRCEYLAYLFYEHEREQPGDQTIPLLERVQAFMSPRYGEGYTKGVHDKDAVSILETFFPTLAAADLLRFGAADRALAIVSFLDAQSSQEAQDLALKARASGLVRSKTDDQSSASPYEREALSLIDSFLSQQAATRLFDHASSEQAATYLVAELERGSFPDATGESSEGCSLSLTGSQALHDFQSFLTSKRLKTALKETIDRTDSRLFRFQIILDSLCQALSFDATDSTLLEAAAHYLLSIESGKSRMLEVEVQSAIKPMLGSHSRISQEDSALSFNLPEYCQRLHDFASVTAPRYEAFHIERHRLIEEKRRELKLHEFEPKVMSAFVRNRLLNEVFLPLIGDNLAKQLGTAGDQSRTDRMGMLLLISPPGYGKTTLMEYVGNRLGMTFVKVNGPAIGHAVTSLDPGEAPNMSAREEMEKLNFSLEMGDNILLYLDDIQHCNPEFLQKFISLCDAQRKIEGVYQGEARTYDLRGKRVAVVMAGNPYTEAGGKFQIPDMLANRADTYNLGDMIGGHKEAFEASYIENSLTSNQTLSRLAANSQKDVYTLMAMAEDGTGDTGELEGNYSPEEVADCVTVLKKLFRVRDAISRVNQEYIHSAAQADEYRTEPAFKLQGSYRNMNRIAEKVLPLMTDEEVDELIMDHYQNESQTLAAGAEANLLKFREILGVLSTEENERWSEIKTLFARNQLMAGGEDDPVSRVVSVLAGLNEALGGIKEEVRKAANSTMDREG